MDNTWLILYMTLNCFGFFFIMARMEKLFETFNEGFKIKHLLIIIVLPAYITAVVLMYTVEKLQPILEKKIFGGRKDDDER